MVSDDQAAGVKARGSVLKARGRAIGLLRSASRAVVAIALVASGIAGAIAARHGLYANLVLACAVAVWLAVLASAADRPVVAPESGAPVAPAQAELRRLRFMLDHAPVPLVLLSAAGTLQAVNRAARGLFGVDDRVAAKVGTPVAAAIVEGARGQRRVIKLGAQDRSYALSVASWSGGEFLAALVDIEAELGAAEAGALRDVLQTLSHEIMNSLTPVMSLAQSARELLAEGSTGVVAPAAVAQAADALETIARRTGGLDRFVQGYRALARVPPALPRTGSVCQLLRDVALLFEMRWRGRVALLLACPEPDVVALLDTDLLGQALTALLTNAAESTLAGAAAPAVQLSGAAAAGRLLLRVADNGAGVPAAHREAIFRPFFTLKPDGTGIGLGLARQIARGHGGALTLSADADADADAGAVFTLDLPLLG